MNRHTPARREKAKKCVHLLCLRAAHTRSLVGERRTVSAQAKQQLVMRNSRPTAKPNIKTLTIANGVRRNKNERTNDWIEFYYEICWGAVLVCAAAAPQLLAFICDFSHSTGVRLCVCVRLVSHKNVWTCWHTTAITRPRHGFGWKKDPNNEKTEEIYRKCMNPPAHSSHHFCASSFRVVGTSSREQKMQIIQWT